MTLFEIADVLWRHGENEAYNALVKHTREYTTIVECGLTLLAKDIARTAEEITLERLIVERDELPLRIMLALDTALDESSPLLNWHLWEEARRRVAACGDLNGVDPERLTWGTYEYLLGGGDEEAELQLDDDRWAEAYMRAAELDSPNAPDFNGLRRRIYEQLCEEDWHAA